MEPSVNHRSEKVMCVAEAAYMAGYLDGEGTISITRAKRVENRAGYRWMPIMAINNTHRDSLECLRQMCGNGRLCLVNPGKLGIQKPGYRLQFTANQIRYVLPQIMPYLIIKREQAAILLEFLTSVVNGKNLTEAVGVEQERLRAEIQRLNHRGSFKPALPAQPIVIRAFAKPDRSDAVH